MARIFIADSDDGIANLKRILGPDQEILVANKTKDALEILRQQAFDLIIVGLHFDESRMFELIPQIKRCPMNADKPMICFCTRDTQMTRTMHNSLDYATRGLGAWMYLDQHEYNVEKEPDAELRRVLERCLTHQARKETLAKRIDIQKERENIHQLRLALESEEWSDELEDELGDLRWKLSKVLLELCRTHISSDVQHHQIETSRHLSDHVSSGVTKSEDEMTVKERTQWLKEIDQLVQEEELVDREEVKRKKGWRKDRQKPEGK